MARKGHDPRSPWKAATPTVQMAVGCLHPALRLRFAIFLLASIVATRTQAEAKPRSIAQVADLFTSVTNATKETLHRILHGDIGLWDMVCLIALCTALHLFTSGGRKKAAPHDDLKISSLSSAGLIRGSDESPNRQKSSLRASRAGMLHPELSENIVRNED